MGLDTNSVMTINSSAWERPPTRGGVLGLTRAEFGGLGLGLGLGGGAWRALLVWLKPAAASSTRGVRGSGSSHEAHLSPDRHCAAAICRSSSRIRAFSASMVVAVDSSSVTLRGERGGDV
ncbi:hypothetical protein EYF80_043082 [Liparis tanakae]|uniref:Uncharacterized protein n=1 Tax=Liparis tanakae TaxID=230148 RepID=A0A4Z2G1D2_9TELE|nr:hypothetical protein EYF80_043082 [Liparis tanakae]